MPVSTARDTDKGRHAGRLLAGRYAIIEQIGVGGMARVYRGRHVTLRRAVAVKILREEFATKTRFVGRFLREARATARIRHPNVVEVLDFGQEPDGTVYCVMELLPGEPLSETLAREGSLSWHRAKQVMLQVCDGLDAAHAVGVVHRDVKPDNCLRMASSSSRPASTDTDGERDIIKVIDFGIAKMASIDDDPLPGGRTAQGTVMGTADYIAPEQARGTHTDHRTDVYGAGVLMYELLTGQVPFSAATSLDLLAQHMYVLPEPPSRVAPLAQVPSGFDEVVLRALCKDPESRFQSIAEMRAAIEALELERTPDRDQVSVETAGEARLRPVTSRRAWSVVVGALMLMAAASVALTTPSVIQRFARTDLEPATATPVRAAVEHVTTMGPDAFEPRWGARAEASEAHAVESPPRSDADVVDPAVTLECVSFPVTPSFETTVPRGPRRAPPPPASAMSIDRVDPPTRDRSSGLRAEPSPGEGRAFRADPVTAARALGRSAPRENAVGSGG